MILVDTTIWVDFFLGRSSKQVTFLVNAINQRTDLCICGVVLTEVLQGVKNPRELQQITPLMDTLVYLDTSKTAYIHASEIYRTLRLKGITVRKTIDCIISAVAIEYKIPLLHNDRDFDSIEKYCQLQVIAA